MITAEDDDFKFRSSPFLQDDQIQQRLLEADDEIYATDILTNQIRKSRRRNNFVLSDSNAISDDVINGTRSNNAYLLKLLRESRTGPICGWNDDPDVVYRKTQNNASSKSKGTVSKEKTSLDTRNKGTPSRDFVFRHYTDEKHYIEQYRKEHVCSDSVGLSATKNDALEAQKLFICNKCSPPAVYKDINQQITTLPFSQNEMSIIQNTKQDCQTQVKAQQISPAQYRNKQDQHRQIMNGSLRSYKKAQSPLRATDISTLLNNFEPFQAVEHSQKAGLTDTVFSPEVSSAPIIKSESMVMKLHASNTIPTKIVKLPGSALDKGSRLIVHKFELDAGDHTRMEDTVTCTAGNISEKESTGVQAIEITKNRLESCCLVHKQDSKSTLSPLFMICTQKEDGFGFSETDHMIQPKHLSSSSGSDATNSRSDVTNSEITYSNSRSYGTNSKSNSYGTNSNSRSYGTNSNSRSGVTNSNFQSDGTNGNSQSDCTNSIRTSAIDSSSIGDATHSASDNINNRSDATNNSNITICTTSCNSRSDAVNSNGRSETTNSDIRNGATNNNMDKCPSASFFHQKKTNELIRDTNRKLQHKLSWNRKYKSILAVTSYDCCKTHKFVRDLCAFDKKQIEKTALPHNQRIRCLIEQSKLKCKLNPVSVLPKTSSARSVLEMNRIQISDPFIEAIPFNDHNRGIDHCEQNISSDLCSSFTDFKISSNTKNGNMECKKSNIDPTLNENLESCGGIAESLFFGLVEGFDCFSSIKKTDVGRDLCLHDCSKLEVNKPCLLDQSQFRQSQPGSNAFQIKYTQDAQEKNIRNIPWQSSLESSLPRKNSIQQTSKKKCYIHKLTQEVSEMVKFEVPKLEYSKCPLIYKSQSMDF